MNEPAPLSRNAVFRIALDTLIKGLLAGTTAYSIAPAVKPAILAGIISALGALQSRLSPDLEKMNRQRQQEQSSQPP